ncbi:unnamed protein product [Linum trigynum]|uniref:Uncharacterized protein n=1 Tax=Linum trigynum TaxID=586398 RepID=A0AAV2EVQ1_9ROSI
MPCSEITPDSLSRLLLIKISSPLNGFSESELGPTVPSSASKLALSPATSNSAPESTSARHTVPSSNQQHYDSSSPSPCHKIGRCVNWTSPMRSSMAASLNQFICNNHHDLSIQLDPTTSAISGNHSTTSNKRREPGSIVFAKHWSPMDSRGPKPIPPCSSSAAAPFASMS